MNGKAKIVLLDVDSFQKLVEKAERMETMEVFQEGRASAQCNEPNPLEPLPHQMPEITLHEEDWDLFYEALVHPPEPTEAFKAAWKEFKAQEG